MPLVWKTPGENLNGRFIPVDIFREETFRGITFFPFLQKQPKFSVQFVCITSARLQVERKRKIYWYFVNGTLNPVPVFGAKKNTSTMHLTEVFYQIPVQMVGAPRPTGFFFFFGCSRCLRRLALHDFIFCLVS